MAIVRPILCVSHTVRGACNIDVEIDTGDDTLVIPEGQYWTDPFGAGNSKDFINVFAGLFASLFAGTNGLGGSYETASPTAGSVNARVYNSFYEHSSAFAAHVTYGDNAATNDEGRRALRRLGLPVLTTSPVLEGSFGVIDGVWGPSLAEFGSLQRVQFGATAALNPTWDGHVFPYGVGEPLRRYMLRLDGIPENEVWQKGQVQHGHSYLRGPFESLIYRYLRQGELLRLYAEGTDAAVTGYVTAAMTKTARTFTVSNSGLTTNHHVWVDGECMRVTGVSGGVNITVERDEPVAHPAYAPFSTGFVGTFALDETGGDINLETFNPKRREYYDSRQDLDIPLVQAVWEG